MSSFTSIPIIDLSLSSSPSTTPALLSQLRHALTEVGFLYIVNHGVPADAVEDVVNALPTLFALSSEDKDEIALRNSPHFLGYSGDGSETTAGRVDRREQVEFATELEDAWEEGKPLSERLKGPNQVSPAAVFKVMDTDGQQWPSAYPELRPVIERYIAEMTLLGERFLRLVAASLSLPPETFLPFLSDQHRLKLVRYPAAEAGTQGVGPHKDSSGWWTFLLQASPPPIGGLQALNREGVWVDVPALPGAFVVNIGQAFEVVTNGICPATTHRVVSGDAERFSVPFFQGVRGDLGKEEAVGSLGEHFGREEFCGKKRGEAKEARQIDSAFLEGRYDTWGESQLRTKVRSHRDVGRRFYGDVFERYVNDDR